MVQVGNLLPVQHPWFPDQSLGEWAVSNSCPNEMCRHWEKSNEKIK